MLERNTLLAQRERERDREDRVQDHNGPQHYAAKRCRYTDPREQDRRRDVEDKKRSHGAPVRFNVIRGQARNAKCD